MITWLKGRVLDIEENEVAINSGNVGYRVYIGENKLLQMQLRLDQEVELVIYTNVREDEIQLYGFESFTARKVFAMLLSVNGIGPKAAINIVDKLSPQDIILAIRTGDHNPFVQVPGIGKKTAQRVILDLQGKAEKLSMDLNLAEEQIDSNIPEVAGEIGSNILDDAKSALSNLGFTDRESERVIRKHYKPGVGIDEIIRKSLADLKQ